MELYLWIKFFHVLAAVVVMGTGTGIAFFLFMANRSNNLAAIAVTTEHVIFADWVFTTPAIIVQFSTGIMLMRTLGFFYDSLWFYWVIGCYSLVGLSWLPVVYIQYRLRVLSRISLESGVKTEQFNRWMRLWTLLGIPGFTGVLGLFYLMMFKPFL